MKSPQLQIYNEIFKISQGLGYDTYDFLPAEEVSYPFVFVGEQSDQDRFNKYAVFGDVQQTIHIFHDYKERREVYEMIDEIKAKARALKSTDNYYVKVIDSNGQIMLDDSTDERLLHGILEIEFTFN